MSRPRRFAGVALVGAGLAGCLESASNFQDPTTSGGTSSATSSSGVTTPGPSSAASDTRDSDPGGPSSTEASTTTGIDPGGTTGSTGGATTGGELPDNACRVKDAYGDLGDADDALGFFVDLAGRSTGVDIFVSPSSDEPFDVIIVELFENEPPFSNVPQPGIYDIEELGGLDACPGVCVSLQGQATFTQSGFVDGMFRLRATSGTLTVTELQWDAAEPTNGSFGGTLQDVTFEEVDGLGEVVPGGCRVTVQSVTFSEPVTNVVPL